MAAHARLSPSGADTWMVCAGAPQAQDGIKDVGSIFAAQGSLLHLVAADCFETGLEPDDFIDTKATINGFRVEVSNEHARKMQPGLDYLREVAVGAKVVIIEERVKLDRWMPKQFGTLDVGMLFDDEMLIWDWKFGVGVPVSPKNNRQLQIYALGFWWKYARHITKRNFRIRIRIEQPLCPGGGGEWVTTLGKLLNFGEEVEAAALATYQKNAPRTPSEKGCMWCKASKNCEALEKFNLELMQLKFDDLTDAEELGVTMPLPDPKTLRLTRRSYIVKHAKMFTRWLEQLHGDVLTDALLGNPTPGLKAVAGRKGDRAWSNEELAERLLIKHHGKKDAYTQKLKSPAQAQKLYDAAEWKKMEKALVFQPDGKPVLVDSSDPREAVQTCVDKFEDLDN